MLNLIRSPMRFVGAWALLLAWPMSIQAQTNVLTQHNDIGRTGQNLTETVLTPANVAGGGFGKQYAVALDGQAYAQPLYMSSLAIGGVSHSVLFAATEHDSVYALDVNAAGAVLWKASLLDTAHGAAVGAIPDPEADTGCSNISPEYGITGTPVIDAASGTLYVVSKTYEGNYPVQRLHALDITTGAEKFGGPVTIAATVAGTGAGSVNGTLSFDPKWENQRPGLLFLNGKVYVGFGSHCDDNDWHGWVMAFSASSGTLTQTAAFNATPNSSAAGIWLSGAGLAADDINGNPRMFVATGNGTFDTNGDWGDSVLNLNLASGISVQDSFTPNDQGVLSFEDLDVGSAGTVVLPDQPGAYPHLAVQLSKAGNMFLLNRENLGGYSTGADKIVQEVPFAAAYSGLWGIPAYYQGSLYFWPADVSMQQYTLTNGVLSTSPVSIGAQNAQIIGASPSVSANGSTNGIVWVVDYVNALGSPIQYLYAYDPNNLANLLWSSAQNAPRDSASGAQKWSVPTIADGRVYITATNQVLAYGLLNLGYQSGPTFGSATPNLPATQSVMVTDSTAGAVITNIQVLTNGRTGGEFSLAGGSTCSVGSAAPCTVNIAFGPQYTGLREGALLVEDSAGNVTTTFFSGSGSGQTALLTSPLQSTVASGLSSPTGVAVDDAGNVYSANLAAGTVTEVNAVGTVIRTIAGLSSPWGVALDGAGNLYVAESGRGDVVRVLPGTTQFSIFAKGFTGSKSPQGLAVDGGGNLYVANAGSNVVNKVSPAGVVTTVGTGSLTLASPAGVAVDSAGDIFVADSGNGRIVEVPATGSSGSKVYAAGFQNPSSVAVNGAGYVFLTDVTANAVYEIVAGTTTPISLGSGFKSDEAVAVGAAGDLYVADAGNGRIVKIQRVATTLNFGSTAPGAPTTQTLNVALSVGTTLSNIAVLTEGVSGGDYALAGGTCTLGGSGTCSVNLTFTPKFGGLRRGALVVTSSGGSTTTVYLSGVGLVSQTYSAGVQSTVVSGLSAPVAVAVDGAGNVYSANLNGGTVTEVNSSGTVIRTISGLTNPLGVALDGAGNLYISEGTKADVVKVLPGATNFTLFANGFASAYSPLGLVTDGNGNVYAADNQNNVVDKISQGGIVTPVNSGTVTFNYPTGLALDGAGNLYVSNWGDGQIVEVPASGGANTSVLAQGLGNASGVALDSSGNLFVASQLANAVYEIPAGSTTPAAVGSGFNSEYELAMSASGDLYVADQNNGRIVKIQRSQAMALQTQQSIAFGAITAQMAGSSITLTATASSGLPVTFASSTPSVCSVSGTTATLLTAGTCTIVASQPGNATYTAAVPVSQSVTVNAAVLPSQTITFAAIGTQSVGTSVSLTATASSGLPVTFASSTPSVCTVSGTTAALLTAGTCTIAASQSGNSSYAAAASVSQNVTVAAVAPQSQTITFAAISTPTVGSSITLTASASSALPVTFASSTPSVCTVSGTTAALLTAGTCTLVASQSGGSSYTAAASVSQSVTVAAAGKSASSASLVSVNLTTAMNIYGIAKDGTAVANGGFDGASYAYSATLLGTAVNWSGLTFAIGAAGAPDGVSSTTVALPAGSYSSISFLAAAAFGNQANQTFIVTYTDGTTTSIQQSLSDWGSPQKFPGESVALTMAYRLAPNGSTNTYPFNLYGYSFALNAAKTVKSITLPANRSVVVMAMDLVRSSVSVNLATAANIYGIAKDGAAVTNGGFDGASYAYSATQLGSAVNWSGLTFAIGAAGVADGVSSTTVALPTGSYSSISFLAAAAFGNQANQTFIVTYTDGTTTSFQQGLSDWGSPQKFPGESVALTMAYRLSPNGSVNTYPFNLYGYSFALNAAKTVKSITLPANRSVVVMAMDLSP